MNQAPSPGPWVGSGHIGVRYNGADSQGLHCIGVALVKCVRPASNHVYVCVHAQQHVSSRYTYKSSPLACITPIYPSRRPQGWQYCDILARKAC